MQSALATHLSQQEQGLQGLMDHFLLPITDRAASGPMPTAALRTPAAGPSPAGGSPTLRLSGALLSPIGLQQPPPHEPRLHHSMSAANNNERLRLAVAELVGDVEDDPLEHTLAAARYHRYGGQATWHVCMGGLLTTMHVCAWKGIWPSTHDVVLCECIK